MIQNLKTHAWCAGFTETNKKNPDFKAHVNTEEKPHGNSVVAFWFHVPLRVKNLIVFGAV